LSQRESAWPDEQPWNCRIKPARKQVVVDGSKALSRAIRRSFGRETAIQRCQIHKARNIMERLPKGLHASVRRALRQAWELDDAAKAERLIRNLAQRLEHEAPGVSGSLLEGLD
jgi:transposase-like protein